MSVTAIAALATASHEVPLVLATPGKPDLGADAAARSQLSGAWVAELDGATARQAGEDELTMLVARAIALCAPADIVILGAPCRPPAGWLQRLSLAAYADTATASASARATDGESPAAGKEQARDPTHPPLSTIELPLAYLRRDALELVGTLDTTLPLPWSLVDLAQRCVLAGLTHVVADDLLVEVQAREFASPEAADSLRERYPYLFVAGETNASAARAPLEAAGSSMLSRGLVRGPAETTVDVTFDARDLGAPLNGTRRLTLELAAALAASGEVRLRALVSQETGAEALAALRALPRAKLVAAEEVDDHTPTDAIFHRPQQMSDRGDLELALQLGERLVLGQLDLLAFRNPGYHPNAAAWDRYRVTNVLALAAATRVLVLSEHTRAELAVEGLAPPRRVRVVPPGLDHLVSQHLAPGEAPAELSSELGDGPFLLCLGADYTHKNRLFALRLLEALRTEHSWQGRLVLAGAHVASGSSRELEHAFLTQRPWLEEAVVDLGTVGEREREWLTKNARALLYPTVYEGFGLVPLEAGAAGVPCLYAAQTSLSEVAPKAATITPWDPAASALAALPLLDEGPARTEHVAMLAASAASYTWAGAARATIAAYREALEETPLPVALSTRQAIRQKRELQGAVALVERERDHAIDEYRAAWDAYMTLKEQVGFGAGLVGPRGALPEDVQRAMLLAVRQPLFRVLVLEPVSVGFRLGRAAARLLKRATGR